MQLDLCLIVFVAESECVAVCGGEGRGGGRMRSRIGPHARYIYYNGHGASLSFIPARKPTVSSKQCHWQRRHPSRDPCEPFFILIPAIVATTCLAARSTWHARVPCQSTLDSTARICKQATQWPNIDIGGQAQVQTEGPKLDLLMCEELSWTGSVLKTSKL